MPAHAPLTVLTRAPLRRAGCLRCTLGISARDGTRTQPCMWCNSPDSPSRCVPFVDTAEGDGLCAPSSATMDSSSALIAPVAARDRCPSQRPPLPAGPMVNASIPEVPGRGSAPAPSPAPSPVSLMPTQALDSAGTSGAGALSVATLLSQASSTDSMVLGFVLGTIGLFFVLSCALGCLCRRSRKGKGRRSIMMDDYDSDIEG